MWFLHQEIIQPMVPEPLSGSLFRTNSFNVSSHTWGSVTLSEKATKAHPSLTEMMMFTVWKHRSLWLNERIEMFWWCATAVLVCKILQKCMMEICYYTKCCASKPVSKTTAFFSVCLVRWAQIWKRSTRGLRSRAKAQMHPPRHLISSSLLCSPTDSRASFST